MKELTCQERLKKLNLYSLKYRRRRGDLIQMYRLRYNMDNIAFEDLFTKSNNKRTRGHDSKLVKQHVKKDQRKFNFTNTKQSD